MRECDGCGAKVTVQYHRVWSDTDGVLHGCPNCTPKSMSKHPDLIREQRGQGKREL